MKTTAVNEDRAVRLADLMRRIADDRDRAAFAELFTILAPKVKFHLRRLGLDDAAAEDLTQDVMVTIWHRAPGYDPARASVVTWVFAIARNRRIDSARRDARALIEPVEIEVEGSEPGPDLVLETIQRERRLNEAVATLPEEQATILRLAFYAGKSHSQIAAEQGVPLGTVKSRVRLALERLRRALSTEK